MAVQAEANGLSVMVGDALGLEDKHRLREFTQRTTKHGADMGKMVGAVALERDCRSNSYVSLVQTVEHTVVDSGREEHAYGKSDRGGGGPGRGGTAARCAFWKWMRGDGGYWCDNADVNRPGLRGRRLRAAIAEKGAAFERASSGITARFRPVLKRL